ncbi:tail fiber protein [Paenibacillus pabuli]|uniref:tail fiber protein n=1 Tax=Paenibacillus pabuli TaxID=1472 RepID=UPI003CEA77A5
MIETMYPAAVNSRQTELAEAIDDTQTSFRVLDGSVLPPAPNLLTLGTDESAETVLYTGKTGNEITGVIRGFESEANSWAIGTKLARYFTAYDHNTFRDNIEDLDNRLNNIPAPQDASLTEKGIVQLSKSTTGDSDTIAATESAVGTVQQQVGNLAELQTADKDNLVDALNEVFTHVDEGKEIVKTAVIVKGGTVAGTSPHSFAELADGIGTIETATVINGQIKLKVVYAENINGNDPIYAVPQIGDVVEIPDRPSGSYSRSVAYSKDGKHMALVLGVSPFIAIYKITDGEYSRLPDPAILPTGDAYSVAFSPEGDLVVGHTNAPCITIYKRSGDTFTKLPNPSVLPTGISYVVAFSPDGVYMVVGHSGLPLLTAYKRSGDTFKQITLTGHPSSVYGISFSPDGMYLALAHTSTPFVTIFKRSGDTFTKLPNPAALPTGNGKSVSFSPDGGLLIVALEVSPFITIYSRSGDVFTKMEYPDVLPTGYATNVVFNTGGDMLAVSQYGTPFITVYRREGTSFIKMNNPTTLPGGAGLGVAFSPDGINLYVVGTGTPFHTMYQISLQAFRSNNSLSNVKSGQSLGYALETGITGDKKDAILIWR